MLLLISLNQKKVLLQLKEEESIIVETSWVGDLLLSEKLLPEIDALLEKNNFSKKDIEKVVAQCDKESSVTSARIIESVVNAWNVTLG